MVEYAATRIMPAVDGLVLIDCWDYSDIPDVHVKKRPFIENFYSNLISNIKNFDIKYVVNAMTNPDTTTVDQNISNQILNHHPRCKLQSYKDFINLCEHDLNKTVTKWYVAGQAWNLCLHHNSIGLNNMSKNKIQDIEFYADQRSFLKETGEVVWHEDFVNDLHSWSHYRDGGYKLIG